MVTELISILGLGFALGLKHAIEPDHVIAVSTIASRSRKLWGSSMAGVYWGIGHTATLLVVGILFLFMKDQIPEGISMSLEFLVGIMLVVLGVSNLAAFPQSTPEKEGGGLSGKKSMAIGFIHGLAGSGAMVLLTGSMVDNVWEGVLYILTFGSGTVIGMLCFTTVIGIPFILSVSRVRINRFFTQLAGGISVAFGAYYMFNLGVTEGLFQMWFH